MMNKSVVTYTLSKCVKCLKCLRVCPTEAVKIEENRVVINNSKCINCGKCIEACHFQGLKAKGSTLVDISNYDYTIALVPSVMIGECKNIQEVEELFHAISALGFDEVVDLSPVEGQLENEARIFAKNQEDTSLITSFCPVINNLIRVKYPMLLNSIIPLALPSEVMAKKLRKNFNEDINKDGKLGIFNLCECVSKLAFAKYPYGNLDSEVDHALAIVDIFPEIKAHKTVERYKCNLCLEGLFATSPSTMTHDSSYIVADGFDKISEILDYAEFGQLNNFDLLALFPCNNGCFGGGLLWGNSFNAINNIRNLYLDANKPMSDLSFNDIYGEIGPSQETEIKSIQERLAFFAKVNAQLEKLPHFDCGACGFASCRIMAEEIAKGNRTTNDCKILRNIKEDSK